jgi:hypothetical protein
MSSDDQLEMLAAMGFAPADRNLALLKHFGGRLDAVVQHLVSGASDPIPVAQLTSAAATPPSIAGQLGVDEDSWLALLAAADGDPQTAVAIFAGYNGGTTPEGIDLVRPLKCSFCA